VPEKSLHLVQIHTGLNQPRGKRVSEVVEMEISPQRIW